MSDHSEPASPPTDATALARAAATQMYGRDRASQHFGIALEEVRPGYARMTMQVQEWMLQGHDVCHGGILYTLADTAMAFASNSHNVVHVTLSANVDYLSQAGLGETLTAVAEEGNRTRRTGLYDVTIVATGGKLVCRFRGRTYGVGGAVLR